MKPVDETKKRLQIAKDIAVPLESIVKGVLLGGSMGFGQNYSVTDESDIDMVVVIESSRLNSLMSVDYFEGGTSQEVFELFRTGKINFFWVTRFVDGVEVNAFVYDMNAYADFCLLRGDLVGFSKKKPDGEKVAWGFDGNNLLVRRKVVPFNDGYLYNKPVLLEGKYWGGVPRQDFFYSGYVVLQENDFFTDLEARTWRVAIEQLVKEHGRTPDLTKTNILNTHYTYKTNRGKLPTEVTDKITKRTVIELEQYLHATLS